jgi:hypothetical protein
MLLQCILQRLLKVSLEECPFLTTSGVKVVRGASYRFPSRFLLLRIKYAKCNFLNFVASFVILFILFLVNMFKDLLATLSQ